MAQPQAKECSQCYKKQYEGIHFYECSTCEKTLQICQTCTPNCPYCYSPLLPNQAQATCEPTDELVCYTNKFTNPGKPNKKSDLSSVINSIPSRPSSRDSKDKLNPKPQSIPESPNLANIEADKSSQAPLPAVTSIRCPSLEVGNVPCQPPHYVSKKRIKQMILHNDVPINCGAIAVLGLPNSAKSTTLEQLFRNCLIADKAESMIRDKKDLPFKLYDVCAFGQYPFKEFIWSYTTKRLAPVYFILSDLARQCALRGFSFESFCESNGDTESIFEDECLDDHFNFLFTECKATYDEHHTESSKFLEGVSLINCFDVGVSKANYDLLPLFAHCFRKLIRFVFLSLENDGCLDDPPNLTYSKYNHLPEQNQIFRNFSRGNYLLRFAKDGYDTETKRGVFKSTIVGWHEGMPNEELKAKLSDLKKKVCISTDCDTSDIGAAIEREWISVNPLEESSIEKLRECVEKKIRQNSHLHITMPLKWIFLRSIIADLHTSDGSNVITPFNTILRFAKKLDMNREDVHRFLTTFTDYASLLYCPLYQPLTEYVITDVQTFMKLLDALYHAKPKYDYVRRYGIITQDAAREILGDKIAIIILDILESLGLAARLLEDQVIVNGRCLSNSKQFVYFMPNVRVKKAIDTPSHVLAANGSLLLCYLTPEKGENEAKLSKSIFSRYPSSKVKLLASEDVNCTKLRIEVDPKSSFELHVLYHGKQSELRLANIIPFKPSKITIMLSTIIEGCCKAMTSTINSSKWNIDFKIGFKCSRSRAGYHYADEIIQGIECDCQKALKGEEGEKMREIWMMAVKKCKIPLSFNSLQRRSNKELLDLKCISKIASQLTDQLLSEEKEDELRVKLGIDPDVLKEDELKDYHGWELFVLLLTIWGKRNSTGNPRKKLKEIFDTVKIYNIKF